MSYRGLYSRIKSIGERTGLPELHPHTLRHTFGTRLYNLEHDLFYVQDQLGHKSTNTTKRYAKTNSAARRRQTEKMNMGIDQQPETFIIIKRKSGLTKRRGSPVVKFMKPAHN